jgi:DNA-binding response OmpR family regulator
LKTPKILIADDDRDHQIMMALMLRKEGYDVISAFDVKHAIQLAVEQNPDILLLDIHMGEEDGYAVQERLQKIDEMANKPVIYITGDQSNWINFIIAGMGAHAVLRKPFSRQDLLTTLKTLLASPPPEQPIAAWPSGESSLPAPGTTLTLNTFAGDIAVPNF